MAEKQSLKIILCYPIQLISYHFLNDVKLK